LDQNPTYQVFYYIEGNVNNDVVLTQTRHLHKTQPSHS